jgi:cyanophycin synthetase
MADAARVLRVLDARVMRGPSVWARMPVIVARVEGAAPEVVGEAAIALQRSAGADVGWCRVGAVGPPPGMGDAATLAIEYEWEEVGLRALRTAVELSRTGVVALDDAAAAEFRAAVSADLPGPTSLVLQAEARRRGIPLRRLPGESTVLLGYGSRMRRMDATMTDRTSVLATEITSDKARTKRRLARYGLPVPRGEVADDVDEAVAIAEEIGYPVLVKPLDANNGRGISGRLDDAAQVREAYGLARAEHARVVVERFVTGRDHRVLVVDGRVVAVTERVPAHVVGDGARPIRALIEEANRDPRRSRTDPLAPLSPVPADPQTEAYLTRRGLTLDTTLDRGAIAYLRGTANICTGGTPVDRTDEIHPDNAAVCAYAADVTGLDVAGVDVVTDDITVPFRESGAAILEVNASPGIRMHTEPVIGGARDAAGAVLDSLFPPEAPSRIPITAVTGTNGKTTTTRLIAHLWRAAGHRVGFTTTDGVYVGDRLLHAGDMTGPMGADMVLAHPRVDVAVLEVARGGILRSGLGFDACDVAVVTNVADDHLDIDGVATVEQLAHAKGVVAEAVATEGCVVLNAEDPLVLAMRGRGAGAVALFCASPLGECPAVAEHVAAGGRAASVEGAGILTLHEGPSPVPLVDVAELPMTLGGAARFQVRNALAATLAAWVGGLPVDGLRDALRAFVPSEATTPGRMNQLTVRGASVVVDYAHNPAGLSALRDYALRVPAGRRIALLSIPGDRNDAAIRAFGAAAVGFDRVVFKEHPKYRRGRPAGETAAMMRDGFLAAGGDPDRAGLALDEAGAVHELLDMLRPDDLAVIVADDLDATLASLRAP